MPQSRQSVGDADRGLMITDPSGRSGCPSIAIGANRSAITPKMPAKITSEICLVASSALLHTLRFILSFTAYSSHLYLSKIEGETASYEQDLSDQMGAVFRQFSAAHN